MQCLLLALNVLPLPEADSVITQINACAWRKARETWGRLRLRRDSQRLDQERRKDSRAFSVASWRIIPRSKGKKRSPEGECKRLGATKEPKGDNRDREESQAVSLGCLGTAMLCPVWEMGRKAASLLTQPSLRGWSSCLQVHS